MKHLEISSFIFAYDHVCIYTLTSTQTHVLKQIMLKDSVIRRCQKKNVETQTKINCTSLHSEAL